MAVIDTQAKMVPYLGIITILGQSGLLLNPSP